MIKTINALKARQNLGQIMNEVSIKEDDYIIERSGKPLVAIIPIGRYWQIQKEKEKAHTAFFQTVDKIRSLNKNINPEIIDQEIEKAIHSVRKKSKSKKS